MKIILFTIFAGLLFLWAGVLALLKWIEPVERKHILGLGGYLSGVVCLLLFLVINTSMTQQKAALTDTTNLLTEQVDNFRIRLGEITERLMGQIEEKAELTQSEMEVRGNLQQERAEHSLTRKRLQETERELRVVSADRDTERHAHFAHRDSLNTERARHADTQDRLSAESEGHRKTRGRLEDTSEKLAASRRVEEKQERDIKALRRDLEKAQDRAEGAEKQVLAQLKSHLSQLGAHTEALVLLQSSVDSIYRKVLKRPRVAPLEAD